MIIVRFAVTVAIAAVIFLVACGQEKPPPRDYFPILKKQLDNLQAAVLEKDTAQIDSLLVPRLREDNRGVDSLLNYVYGPADTFAFEKFGNYQIVYSHNRARIDCYVMDSTDQENRPATLTYELQKEQWLLKSWGPTTSPMTTQPPE
jgi:hypothetical protein